MTDRKPRGVVRELFPGAQSSVDNEAAYQQRAVEAIANLDELRARVIKDLYGIGGGQRQTHDDLAHSLTHLLSEGFRLVLAAQRGILAEDVRVTSDMVREIENEALRDLRGPLRH